MNVFIIFSKIMPINNLISYIERLNKKKTSFSPISNVKSMKTLPISTK